MRAAEILQAAQRVADEVLAPAAAEVDATGRLPQGQLDVLAAAGLYGLAGPVEAGGLGADRDTALRVVEVLAAGCLATTFVWLQHQGVVRAVDRSPLAPGWLPRLCSGEVRAGVAVAGVRPGTDPLRVRRDGAGWVLDGSVPWVTGWGLIDVVHVAAVDEGGGVTWLLTDATATPTLRAEPLDLLMVAASRTVTLTFGGHRVPADRVTSRTTYEQWQAADVGSLRGNGSLALGLALRCAAALTEDDAVRGRVDAVRDALDAADATSDGDHGAALALARADASTLALTSAGRLAVSSGGRAVLAGSPAERALREAAFLLVFGSRPPIRAALLDRLTP